MWHAEGVRSPDVSVWQLLFPRDPETWFPSATWLWRATGGLINVTLTANLANQLVVIVALLIGLGTLLAVIFGPSLVRFGLRRASRAEPGDAEL